MIPPVFATINASTPYMGAGLTLIILAWGNFSQFPPLPIGVKTVLTLLGLATCIFGVWLDFRETKRHSP